MTLVGVLLRLVVSVSKWLGNLCRVILIHSVWLGQLIQVSVEVKQSEVSGLLFMGPGTLAPMGIGTKSGLSDFEEVLICPKSENN